jgi:superoxide dismutase, Cu-Zn family
MESQMRKLVLLVAAIALTACVSNGEPEGGAPIPLISSAAQSIGSVRTWQTSGGVAFKIYATGLPHGLHGIHVHSVGRCDPPDFASAGPHWNPLGRQHGLNNPAGPHAGDMRNVEVEANGVLETTVTLPGASMASLLDADGAALVLHASPDDYVSDPSGNSGTRIACAVLQPAAEIR